MFANVQQPCCAAIVHGTCCSCLLLTAVCCGSSCWRTRQLQAAKQVAKIGLCCSWLRGRLGSGRWLRRRRQPVAQEVKAGACGWQRHRLSWQIRARWGNASHAQQLIHAAQQRIR
jgi:hypothetical protein